MSATHILGMSGTTLCRREQIRGYVAPEEYRHLAASGKLRKRKRSSVKHNCRKRPCDCPHRREEISGFCADCRKRIET